MKQFLESLFSMHLKQNAFVFNSSIGKKTIRTYSSHVSPGGNDGGVGSSSSSSHRESEVTREDSPELTTNNPPGDVGNQNARSLNDIGKDVNELYEVSADVDTKAYTAMEEVIDEEYSSDEEESTVLATYIKKIQDEKEEYIDAAEEARRPMDPNSFEYVSSKLNEIGVTARANLATTNAMLEHHFYAESVDLVDQAEKIGMVVAAQGVLSQRLAEFAPSSEEESSETVTEAETATETKTEESSETVREAETATATKEVSSGSLIDDYADTSLEFGDHFGPGSD